MDDFGNSILEWQFAGSDTWACSTATFGFFDFETWHECACLCLPYTDVVV